MSLRQRLKVETASHHHRLEAALDVLQMRTRAEYVALLARFYGFYEPAEQELDAAPPELAPHLINRRKTPLLVADLAHFGYSPAELARVPRCSDAPGLDSRAQVLGAFYVYEGSTLGGRFIGNHFAEALQLDTAGLAFFRGYGDGTGPMWQAYCQLLDDWTGARWEDEVVAAARSTFAKLQHWLAPLSETPQQRR